MPRWSSWPAELHQKVFTNPLRLARLPSLAATIAQAPSPWTRAAVALK